MHEEVNWWLDQAIFGLLREVRLDRDRQVNKNHGRLETRQFWCTEQVEWFADRDQWAGLSSLIAVDGRPNRERATVFYQQSQGRRCQALRWADSQQLADREWSALVFGREFQ
jgi:hypothetical protein